MDSNQDPRIQVSELSHLLAQQWLELANKLEAEGRHDLAKLAISSAVEQSKLGLKFECLADHPLQPIKTHS